MGSWRWDTDVIELVSLWEVMQESSLLSLCLPCEQTETRWSSTGSLTSTELMASSSWTFKPSEIWEINCYCLNHQFIQFSSVTQSCPILCDPMKCSTLGLPVYHQLPASTHTYLHWVGDASQPSHPLLSPCPPALNLCQHQGLFKWVNSLYQVAKVLEFQLQHQSFQWTPRTDLL